MRILRVDKLLTHKLAASLIDLYTNCDYMDRSIKNTNRNNRQNLSLSLSPPSDKWDQWVAERVG